MFSTEHPLLGDVNSIEQSVALGDLKAKVSMFQQEMMRLRNQGSDDTQAKAMLTMYSQQMEALKKGGSDIDVVPLWEVDAEVAERCAGTSLPTLEFAQDVTFVREARSKPFTLAAPAMGMGPARCSGLRRASGEWPMRVDDSGGHNDEEEADEAGGGNSVQGWENEEEEEVEDVEELEEEEVEEGGCSLSIGDEVEAYWPDDDTWILATIVGMREDGSWLITWMEDGSQSEVPADYVRSVEMTHEPPVKRTRLGAR